MIKYLYPAQQVKELFCFFSIKKVAIYPTGGENPNRLEALFPPVP